MSMTASLDEDSDEGKGQEHNLRRFYDTDFSCEVFWMITNFAGSTATESCYMDYLT